MKYFHQIDFQDIKNHCILIDIDGTLAAHNQEVSEPMIFEQIEKIKPHNYLLICSNNYNQQRQEKTAQDLNIEILTSSYKKPNPRVLENLSKKNQPILIIGDKFLTDQRLARKTRTKFIKVKRVTATTDPWYVKISYWFDDFFYWLDCRLS